MNSKNKLRPIYVLDDTVILYDSNCIDRFPEADFVLPIIVIELLGKHKEQPTRNGANAKAFLEYIGQRTENITITEWHHINGPTQGQFKVVLNEKAKIDAQIVFQERSPEHLILNCALAIKEQNPTRDVTLITKSTTQSIKAKSLGLFSMDYINNETIDDDYVFEITYDKETNISIGYLFAEWPDEIKDLTIDFFKGFEEFLKVKNSNINLSIDNSILDKVAVKIIFINKKVENRKFQELFNEYIYKTTGNYQKQDSLFNNNNLNLIRRIDILNDKIENLAINNGYLINSLFQHLVLVSGKSPSPLVSIYNNNQPQNSLVNINNTIDENTKNQLKLICLKISELLEKNKEVDEKTNGKLEASISMVVNELEEKVSDKGRIKKWIDNIKVVIDGVKVGKDIIDLISKAIILLSS